MERPELHPIIFLDNDFTPVSTFLKVGEYDRFFILVDENTIQHCLPKLIAEVEELADAEILEIESGEENKSLEITAQLWLSLAELEASRKSLFINLGGGVICDLGGFLASTYKRGMDFIHIPTSLLAQVDASIGGKTGIDFGGLKNQIGLFSQPQHVFIEASFLESLPQRHVLNGYAEMLKHGLIADANYWKDLCLLNELNAENLSSHIKPSVDIKSSIVNKDYKESGGRKVLNFGHTIGHALESYSLFNDTKPMFHGEAVAAGMIAEAYLSHLKLNLAEDDLNEIVGLISARFQLKTPNEDEFENLLTLMKHDKKNEKGEIRFSLIEEIGKAKVNVICQKTEVLDALSFLKQTFSS